MNVDPQRVIENLVKQVGELARANAILEAALQQVIEEAKQGTESAGSDG